MRNINRDQNKATLLHLEWSSKESFVSVCVKISQNLEPRTSSKNAELSGTKKGQTMCQCRRFPEFHEIYNITIQWILGVVEWKIYCCTCQRIENNFLNVTYMNQIPLKIIKRSWKFNDRTISPTVFFLFFLRNFCNLYYLHISNSPTKKLKLRFLFFFGHLLYHQGGHQPRAFINISEKINKYALKKWTLGNLPFRHRYF